MSAAGVWRESALDVARRVLLVAAYLLLWLLARPYRGLDNDAQLYAFQAFNRLNPALLSGDVFVRLGSQDDYSLFPAMLAPLVSVFGIEHMAALITSASFAAFLAACVLLARRLMPPHAATLAIGLVLILPAYYGGYSVFRVAEVYLTPRVLAEALVIVGLAISLSGNRIASLCVAIVAFLVHPLMALPGILLLVAMTLKERHLLWLAIGGLGVLLLAAVVSVHSPVGPLSLMDSEWLRIVRMRSVFLFPTGWLAGDWYRVGIVAQTLILVMMTARNTNAYRFAAYAMLIGSAGLFVATFASYLPIELLVMGQPWRWLWLPTLLAILMMPLAIHRVWFTGAAGRATACFLVLAWVLEGSTGFALGVASLLSWGGQRHLNAFQARMLGWGGWAAVITVTAWLVAEILNLPDLRLGEESPALEWIRNVFGFPAAFALVAFASWLATRALTKPAFMAPVALFVAATLPLAAHSAYRSWTAAPLALGADVVFEPWREIIPPGAEVLWLNNPLNSWFMLHRPSYLTTSQSAGVVFSRETAMEINRRAIALAPIVDSDWLLGMSPNNDKPDRELTAPNLRAICSDPALGFVVSPEPVAPTAPSVEWPIRAKRVWLLDCADYR